MEIKKFLEKIYEIYFDFSDFFKKFPLKSPKRDKSSSFTETVIIKNDLKKEMLFFFIDKKNSKNNTNSRNNINNISKSPNNQNDHLIERIEVKDSKIENYIDNFLNLMFDEVKNFKIIRPKKTRKK